MSGRDDRRAFILPLAVMLVVFLTISGTAFLQHDFLERRMAMNEVDNHGAFYLAIAGTERARETYKIPDSLSWTSMLTDPTLLDTSPMAPVLCDAYPTKGCIKPPFGMIADATNSLGFPFAATFDQGQYEVRAFNNASGVVIGGVTDSGTIDSDQTLTVRALGTIRGEQKLIQVNILAVSDLDELNCQGNVGDPCPETNPPGSPQINALPGREPAAHPNLPSLPPLENPAVPGTCNPVNYYCDSATNFSTLTRVDLPPGNQNLTPADNHYYFAPGDVTIQSTGTNTGVIVVSLGKLDVQGNVTLNNSIMIGAQEVQLQGSVTLKALPPYPAVISEGLVKADTGVVVYGAIVTTGNIDLNPIQVHGILVGNDIKIQGSASLFTDDGNIANYALWPGFSYTPENKSAVPVSNSWRELQ